MSPIMVEKVCGPPNPYNGFISGRNRRRGNTGERRDAMLFAMKAREASGSQRGQGLVEYALIIALIALVVIVALRFLGGTVGNTYNNIGEKVKAAPG